MNTPDSPTEAARLARLQSLAVLDTPAEPLFDTFTRMAALVCGAPTALISLIDHDRQWFKSSVGMQLQQTPRDQAFCNHTIRGDDLFEIPDAATDQRFADNPLVTGALGIRFYAGVPIVMPGGERIGTLCVVDQQPRQLDASQRAHLTELSLAVMQALLLRESALKHAWQARSRFDGATGLPNALPNTLTDAPPGAMPLTADVGALMAAEHAALDGERKFRILSDSAPVGVFHADAEGRITYTNAAWRDIYGVALAQSLGDDWAQNIHPDDRTAVWAAWRQATAAARDFEMDFRIQRSDGSLRQLHSRGRPIPGNTAKTANTTNTQKYHQHNGLCGCG